MEDEKDIDTNSSEKRQVFRENSPGSEKDDKEEGGRIFKEKENEKSERVVEGEEELYKKKKYLFIDDNGAWLSSIKRALRKENVMFEECHSVEEAIRAIEQSQPDVLFLDNSLSEEGNEGLKIVEKLRGSGIVIYSITADESLREKYSKLGVEVIGKSNLGRIRELIK
jgi:CheY-like chemotaxis protein